jgi:hypothetical protein
VLAHLSSWLVSVIIWPIRPKSRAVPVSKRATINSLCTLSDPVYYMIRAKFRVLKILEGKRI